MTTPDQTARERDWQGVLTDAVGRIPADLFADLESWVRMMIQYGKRPPDAVIYGPGQVELQCVRGRRWSLILERR